MQEFNAYVVRENGDQIQHKVETVKLEQLSPGDTLIEVSYSSMNYKDMLALQPKGGVIREYPMIPGIDLAGTIISSESPDFKAGDEVLINSYGLGTVHTGGLSQSARVPHEWLVKLPENLSLKEAMIYGTAGFTAALSIDALEKHGMTLDDQPEILVTGATGGVGSIATRILHQIGYQNITATIRKEDQVEKAKKLGATKILDTREIEFNNRPLNKRQYDFVVDTVGGELAADILSKVSNDGSVAISGNAGGIKLETTVLPFILRGINLLGINSVEISHDDRVRMWDKLANEWYVIQDLHYQEVALEDIGRVAEELKSGSHLGRTIVNVKMD